MLRNMLNVSYNVQFIDSNACFPYSLLSKFNYFFLDER